MIHEREEKHSVIAYGGPVRLFPFFIFYYEKKKDQFYAKVLRAYYGSADRAKDPFSL